MLRWILFITQFLLGRNTKQFFIEKDKNNLNLEEPKISLESNELKNVSMFLIFFSL